MSDAPPEKVQELASQLVEYVRRAFGIVLEYDSDTLPVLDQYLRGAPQDQPATLELMVVTAGAYFGEVIRRRLGGRWELGDEPRGWRLVLPSALSFSPAGMSAAAIAMADLEELDTAVDAPPRIRVHLQEALQRMGQISEEEYYSLCGRLDTLEHLHEVMVAVAAELLGGAAMAAEGDGGDSPRDEDDEDSAGEDADANAGQPPDSPAPGDGPLVN